MTGRTKLLLWLGLIGSLPAGGYAAMCVVFYAWLNAADPARWPAARASIWAYSSIAFTVMFLGLFIYCLVSLIKGANRQYRDELASKEAVSGPLCNSRSGWCARGRENRVWRDSKGLRVIDPATKRVAKYYGTWAAMWVAVAFFGNTFADHGEYGECAHIVLLMTGPPFALLSLHIIPNGSTLATVAAGIIGLVQWSVVAEANARWEAWRKSRNG